MALLVRRSVDIITITYLCCAMVMVGRILAETSSHEPVNGGLIHGLLQ
jgi:hypothetical protein